MCKEKAQTTNKQANRTNEYNKIIMENWNLISVITFIRYAQSQDIGKSKDFKCFWEQENQRKSANGTWAIR
jgi:hypothetical protein